MAELASVLMNFPSESPRPKSNIEYDKQARSFVQQLSNISASHYLKGADTPQDILELLNPAVNSIAYCYCLLARVASVSEKPQSPKQVPDAFRPQGATWAKIAEFLETADPVQLRYIGPEWRRLVEYTERVARLMGSPGAAISPIRSAMIRLDPSTGTFTSTHLLFIRLCMEARSYGAALLILENYIHSLPSSIPKQVLELEASVPSADHSNSGDYIHAKSGHSEKITITNVQEYYVLGAMAYIGLNQWEKAMHFLEHVLASPSANLANGLMVEAYKKWVLVSCLAKGSLPQLPRTANSTAIKQVRALSKAYEALAEAFQAMDFPKLRAQADTGVQIWSEDGNYGLVATLFSAQYRFYISKLQNTYSAVPVSSVASMLEIPEKETLTQLQQLIAHGDLNADIERVSEPEDMAILRFFQDPTRGPLGKSEKQQQEALLRQTERTNILTAQVEAVDYRFNLTKEYLDYVKRQNKKAAANASGEGMDAGLGEAGDVDEDLMMDLH